MTTLFDEAKAMQRVFGCSFERGLVLASERNPELNEPGPSPKKTVYPNVRLPQMPGGTDTTNQSEHAPAVSPSKAEEPEIWDPEERAQKLASYAYAIKREKGWDFFRAWNQAVAEHPELIGSSDGMSKDIEVPSTNVVAGANKLPDSGANCVTASYKDIGMARFR
jgi:hypothetical protein